MIRNQYDIALHFEHLRIVQLIRPGIYTLQAQIFHNKQKAFPYYNQPKKSKNLSIFNSNKLIPLDHFLIFRIQINCDVQNPILQIKLILHLVQPQDKRLGQQSNQKYFYLCTHSYHEIVIFKKVSCIIGLCIHSTKLGFCKRAILLQIGEFNVLSEIDKQLILKESKFRDNKIHYNQLKKNNEYLIYQHKKLFQEKCKIAQKLCVKQTSQYQLDDSQFKTQIMQIINLINNIKEPRYTVQKGIQLTRKKKTQKQEQQFQNLFKIKQDISFLWIEFLILIRKHKTKVLTFYRNQQYKRESYYWNQVMSINFNKMQSLVCQQPQHQTKKLFNKSVQNQLKNNTIISIHQNFFSKKIHKQKLDNQQTINYQFQQQKHLVIFVHGFRGRSNHMEYLRLIVSMLNSKAICVCSSINENNTNLDIRELGIKLADEVQRFVINISFIRKLSFVGHSLGGIIIRAALPHLKNRRNLFTTFLTLSSPHIGFTDKTSTIINFGLWFLRALQQIPSLIQLSLRDNQNVEQTFLYQLSLDESLQYFKDIVLVGSKQDLYAPFDSAVLYSNHKMAQNILRNIQKIRRIDVLFNITEYGIDEYIGRTAHILFLSAKDLFKALHCFHPKLFQ